MRIAAILTCFNRKEKTLKCLDSLLTIHPEIDVFLTDDGSTDGTSEAVNEHFPKVNVIRGDGNLYWSRGMYKAWKEALKGNYDFYLWLNDDVELYPDFLSELMECHALAHEQSIISGIIEDCTSKEIIYGGYDENKALLLPNGDIQKIKYMNGNVVLVPSDVVDRIGIIDPVFHHGGADSDYGLTALENGVGVFTTRKCIAMGYKNDFCRIRKWGTGLCRRFKILYSPMGNPPNIDFHYRKKHFGVINATMFYCYLHFINLLPDFVIKTIWGNKYMDK